MNKAISGFSKLSKEEKIKWIANEYFSTPTDAVALLKNYWNLTKNYSNYTMNSSKILSLISTFRLSCP
jgi:hypothetical protein